MPATTTALLLSLFWPTPRQVAPRPDVVLRPPFQIAAPGELAGPAALLKRELERLFGPGAVAPAGQTVIRLDLDTKTLTRPEEYSIEATGATLRLAGHEAQGAFWAVQSLVQLIGSHAVRRTPTGWAAPGVSLRDWPESPFRAFMIQGAWTPSAEAFKRNLDVMARMKIRYFALEFGPQVVLDFDPSIAKGGKFTKAQAREIVDYGRSLGMEPIGYLNLLGHLDRAYQKPPYTDHGGIMIQNDETYGKFVTPILSEMLDVYGPIEYFHCGMDEAWELFTWFSGQGMNSADLVARHVQKVNDFLKARGVKLVIWHDMFFDRDLSRTLGAPVGQANGGPPQNTATAFDKIPRDVILDYWFYTPYASYPGLDYLKEKGFQTWVSPWQSPFSFTRYAQARGVPVMGTLWTGPPGCWSSTTYSPVTALQAQASWNPGAAPAEVTPEPAVAPAAQRATDAELWGRGSLAFAGTGALLLSPGKEGKATRLAWPADAAKAPDQRFGVPFDFSAPASRPALAGLKQPLQDAAAAGSILLRGTQKLALDGANSPRHDSQLILYGAPQTTTGTNQFGAEVAVSADGLVLKTDGSGPGNMAIPTGGFVLSCHLGSRDRSSRSLLALRPGDRVAVFDAAGNWLAGAEPIRLEAEMPDGTRAAISAIDRAPADAVRLLVTKGGRTRELGEALAEMRWSAAVGAACPAVYLSAAAEGTAAQGTPLGRFAFHYQDGTQEGLAVRYGHQALALEGREPPQSMDGSAWVIDGPRALVLEWENPKPASPLASVSFEPAPASLEVGYRILAATCAVR